MKHTRGFPAFWLLFLVVGGLVGYVFLSKKKERRYQEILVSVAEGRDAAPLRALAKENGFELRPRAWVVGPNEFTRKNHVFSIRKYDLDPAKLNVVVSALERMKVEGGLLRAIEPNFTMRTSDENLAARPARGGAAVNDPLYARQWNLQRLRMDEVWKRADGKGVVVAVIDTGVSRALPDLSKDRLTAGYNFVAKNDDFEDDHGHGSHVAGTIGQDTDNGVGVAGVAPKVKIMPLKVLSKEGSGSTLDIAEAIVYAADKGANVINMSLGGGGYTRLLADACEYARKKGVVVVAAAGNSGAPQADYPGRYPSVISVAAATRDDRLAGYSNFGEGVDVIAPGGETKGGPEGGILQNAPAFLGDKYPHEIGAAGYYWFQGTSMAAPHVAGIAALLHQKGVRDPEKMKALLVSSSDSQVNGIPYVNPLGALDAAKSGAGSAPTAPPRAPIEKRIDPAGEESSRGALNAGMVATTPLQSGVVLGAALFLLFVFNALRKKRGAIESVFGPTMFVGLLLGATGLSFLGFLQAEAPFTWLPERLSGLAFNSIFDYDRVLFGLTKPSPLWHNFLTAALFMVVFNFRSPLKRLFSMGLLLGFCAKLLCEGIFVRELVWLPSGVVSSAFLVVNALVVFTFPFVMAKNE